MTREQERERALELATEAMIHSDHPLERVTEAILQACREERGIVARIIAKKWRRLDVSEAIRSQDD